MLKQALIISLLIFPVFTNIPFAQEELEGPLSGVLPTNDYQVIGPITVTQFDSLTIEAGSNIVFQGDFTFEIYGYLHADGTEDSMIYFMPVEEGVWGGIEFYDSSSDSSRLDYCYITGSNSSGVACWGSNTTISHCTITDNINLFIRGGGVACRDGAHPRIEYSTITDNYGELDGGGLYMMSQSGANIYGCIITGNTSEYGGGIYNNSSSSIISGCYIADNTALVFGGGIYNYGPGETEISKNIIVNNHSEDEGGGIHCRTSAPVISKCTIVGNSAESEGGGIYCGYSSGAQMVNLLLYDNLNSGIYTDEEDDAVIIFSDFYGNEGGDLSGITPPEAGVLVTTNFNGDSCDLYQNIFLDPLFEDPDSLNFSLTWNSPCLDAGAPEFGLDPDGTPSDIGAMYFHQFPPSLIFLDVLLDFGDVEIEANEERMLNVFNEGLGYAIIDSVNLQNISIQTVLISDELPIVIPPDSNETITIEWNPSQAGDLTGMISIFHNDVILNNPYLVELTGTAFVDVVEDHKSLYPNTYEVSSVYPNPFNSSAAIEVGLPNRSYLRVQVVDLLGRVVLSLAEGQYDRGYFNFMIDGTGLSSGVYFVKVEAHEKYYRTEKVIFLK